jgi:hypothetical protein
MEPAREEGAAPGRVGGDWERREWRKSGERGESITRGPVAGS